MRSTVKTVLENRLSMLRHVLRLLLPSPLSTPRRRTHTLLTARQLASAGVSLKLFVAVAESPLGHPIRSQLMRLNKIPQARPSGLAAASTGAGPDATPLPLADILLARWHLFVLHSPSVLQMLEEVFIPERPTFHPNTSGWAAEDASSLAHLDDLPAAQRAAASVAALQPFWSQLESTAPANGNGGGSGQRYHTAADFRRAYVARRVTPAQVAENIIAAVAASEAQVIGGLVAEAGAGISAMSDNQSVLCWPSLPAVSPHALLRGARPPAPAQPGRRRHGALGPRRAVVAARWRALCGCAAGTACVCRAVLPCDDITHPAHSCTLLSPSALQMAPAPHPPQ